MTLRERIFDIVKALPGRSATEICRNMHLQPRRHSASVSSALCRFVKSDRMTRQLVRGAWRYYIVAQAGRVR